MKASSASPVTATNVSAESATSMVRSLHDDVQPDVDLRQQRGQQQDPGGGEQGHVETDRPDAADRKHEGAA